MSNAAYSGLLLSILMLWAYLHAMQYIIVWSGNLPDEMDWYLTRLDGGWRFVLWTLFIGQFFLPFFALLSEDVRSNTSALFRLAAATLVLRFVEAAVLILPPLHVTNAALAICLPAATLMIGASWWLAWQAVDPIWTRWSDRPATAH